MYTAYPDVKSHYGVIIVGSGLSGVAANVQLKRKGGFQDVICYEAEEDFGGTWAVNTFPGAAADIPISLYSYSVVGEQKLYNIHLRTAVETAHYDQGIWTVRIRNLATGETAVKTCNILITAVGALRTPLLPAFAVGNTTFEGKFWHSARWDHSAIMGDVASLTQVARSRQSYIPPPPVPTHWLWFFLCRWVPFFLYFQRFCMLMGTEFFFVLSDIEKGVSRRAMIMRQILTHMRKTAPAKYHAYLTPDFELGGKRRVVDWGYMKSMHSPKFTLVQDDEVVSMDGLTVKTAKGVEIDADIVIYSTGFEVHKYFAPFVVTSSQCDVDISTHYRTTSAKAYRGTFVHGFPNLITLFGPNVGTGHSSLVFTVEAQIA
ncbi:hypothetical protein RQP46_009140 [Phenoliferia psychrophenolica]